KLFATWVIDEGAEGLVARSDAVGTYKIKPRYTLDAVVIGFTEGLDDRSGLLHDLLLALLREDGSYQVLGRVGGGFSEEQRRDLLSDFKDLTTNSDYTEVNSDRVAYQMTKPETVVEISCLDVIAQTTRGGNINRMVLCWDAPEQCWRTERRLPLVSVISPEFIRIREDKSPVPAEISIKQLTDLVEIKDTEKSLEDLQLPKSEVLKKEIRIKELKGAQMVRKLVLWQTNKEQQSPLYPAYVLYHTDFSPNRKSQLDRDIRVSNDLEQIEAFWEELEKKKFVRGWKTLDEASEK
ncbi:MAG: hypothetical protein AAF514_14230, partial [Verrucomicrobiota bacterium]